MNEYMPPGQIPQQPQQPEQQQSSKTDELISAINKNSDLLEKMYTLMRKDRKRDNWRMLYHTLMTIIPLAIVLYITWYLYDMVNSNVEALREFIEKVVPDFDEIGESLKDGWNDLKFWD